MSSQKLRRGENPARLIESGPLYWGSVSSVVASSDIQDGTKRRLLGAIRGRNARVILDICGELEAQSYASATDHFVAHQIVALFKKYPYSVSEASGLDPETAALAKFYSAELRCSRVNHRFRALSAGRRVPKHSDILEFARRYIRSCLGHLDLGKVYGYCDFASGASVGVNGNATNIGRKLLADKLTVTPTALPYALGAMWSNDHIRELVLFRGDQPVCLCPESFRDRLLERVERVSYNKVTFVPKTAKTHRSIAVEPLLNGFLQKGVDGYMRSRLKRFRIDLADQSLNQRLARQGSLGGANPYATIDLSSASDSISFELVRYLLPESWFDFLNSLRSPSYTIGASQRRYHKFVSMGNGFCFPLETLIFAALCYGVTKVNARRLDFSVYGDDIIIRRDLALQLKEVLAYCGFTVNPDKSFLFGPFRESCGADWYEGQDVRPVYVKRPLSNPREVASLHNATFRSERCELFLSGFRDSLRSGIPKSFLRLRPTKEPGEGAFGVPLDLFMGSASAIWNRTQMRWAWREYIPRVKRDRIDHPAARLAEYLAVLRGSSAEAPLALRYSANVSTIVR